MKSLTALLVWRVVVLLRMIIPPSSSPERDGSFRTVVGVTAADTLAAADDTEAALDLGDSYCHRRCLRSLQY